MGVDPTTGMYTPDVSYQPTGALGAVTSLLNSGKAQQIADTLQQQRQAQADLESQQSQQYGLATQRAQAVRDAIGQLVQNNPDASVQDYRSAALGAGGDIAPWTSTFRSETAASGKENVARINAMASYAKTAIANGKDPQDVFREMQAFSDDPNEVNTAMNLAGPAAPKPTAQAAESTAKAKRISEMTPEEVKLVTSKSELARAEAGYYGVRKTLASVKDPTDPAYGKAISRLNSIDASVARLMGEKGYNMGMNPEAQQQVNNLLAEKADVQKEVDRINAARRAKAGPAGPGTAAPTLPAWMGGGATPSASAVPSPTTKTLVFPP